ncbi:MAG: hypothetical protein V1807_03140 [Patescibacteria group bacterium]
MADGGIKQSEIEAAPNNSGQRSTSGTVFLILVLVALIAIGFWAWQNFSTGAAAVPSLQVGDLMTDKQVVTADGVDFATVEINILRDTEPAEGIWVGLKVKDPKQVTNEFDHFGWYASTANQSFAQTDANGRVKFEVKSKIAGEIVYAIFAADPQHKDKGEYDNLDFSFPLKFE